MNKERRVVAQLLADLCGAYGRERAVPPKVLMILRDGTKALADTEERSVKKMEAFKDSDGTAQNYRNAAAAAEDLRNAQEALEEAEIDEAYPLLKRVADPSFSAPEEPAPVIRHKRRRAS